MMFLTIVGYVFLGLGLALVAIFFTLINIVTWRCFFPKLSPRVIVVLAAIHTLAALYICVGLCRSQ